jgi:hypothetical protein
MNGEGRMSVSRDEHQWAWLPAFAGAAGRDEGRTDDDLGDRAALERVGLSLAGEVPKDDCRSRAEGGRRRRRREHEGRGRLDRLRPTSGHKCSSSAGRHGLGKAARDRTHVDLPLRKGEYAVHDRGERCWSRAEASGGSVRELLTDALQRKSTRGRTSRLWCTCRSPRGLCPGRPLGSRSRNSRLQHSRRRRAHQASTWTALRHQRRRRSPPSFSSSWPRGSTR